MKIEIKPPPTQGLRFPEIRLETLPLGTRCFVWMRERLYGAVVIEQSAFDQWTRLDTEAARLIRAPWTTMSFQWRDGLPAASRCDRDACLIVPRDEQEMQSLTAMIPVPEDPQIKRDRILALARPQAVSQFPHDLLTGDC